MRHSWSLLSLGALLSLNLSQSSFSAESPTPTLKTPDSEKMNWISLYKNPLQANASVACMIEIPARTAYLRAVGNQSIRHGGNEYWNKKTLDKTWGSGTRVDGQTYRYQLQASPGRKEIDDFQIEAKFENHQLHSYKIYNPQAKRPCWIHIHEEY